MPLRRLRIPWKGLKSHWENARVRPRAAALAEQNGRNVTIVEQRVFKGGHGAYALPAVMYSLLTVKYIIKDSKNDWENARVRPCRALGG
ncbi:hypothetical protein TL16_g02715 [Triparma laevis f. inornata]|uniref:Uncharacterized protein n=1 Tax=Triparma laevis f. inornata TaxID=1714386 RepID=A0A9W6ZX12_9STRA|nr:hypothetical protein TL16_g02715 [Triparma laevis f. inornata]